MATTHVASGINQNSLKGFKCIVLQYEYVLWQKLAVCKAGGV